MGVAACAIVYHRGLQLGKTRWYFLLLPPCHVGCVLQQDLITSLLHQVASGLLPVLPGQSGVSPEQFRGLDDLALSTVGH